MNVMQGEVVTTFGQKVATLCYEQYDKLGNRGKPQQGKEWTFLAGFVKTDAKVLKNGTQDVDYEVICLATGSKCIGASSRSLTGDIVNDSHAEVLARRLLIRYLYQQLLLLRQENSSVFVRDCDWNISVKKSVKFHLFISHTPCGDASIIPKKHTDEQPDQLNTCHKPSISTRKRGAESHDLVVKQKCVPDDKRFYGDLSTSHSYRYEKTSTNSSETAICICEGFHSTESKAKDLRTKEFTTTSVCAGDSMPVAHQQEHLLNSHDIFRTGAKCVPKGKQDPHRDGCDYHIVSALRIKPGRGDKTLSMSCSDKIMKWCTLGIQGGLLLNIIKYPIFLSSIVFGKCPFSLESATRALSLRGRNLETSANAFTFHKPNIHLSGLQFIHSKDVVSQNTVGEMTKTVPSGSAILWCKEPLIHEVSCNGKKQGIIKSKIHRPEARVSVCKMDLFKVFLKLAKEYNIDIVSQVKATYQNCKHLNNNYIKARTLFFTVFDDWVKKPDKEEMFRVEECL